jgi:rhodanese-related sulfurtransferase
MRKLLISLMAIGLVLGFTACGGGGGSDNTVLKNDSINTGLTGTNLPKEFEPGKYGDINLTENYQIPKEALFLDIRNPYERYKEGVHDGRHAEGSVDGAIFQFRPSHVINDNFVNDVLDLVDNNRSAYIIMICNSSSRTKDAAEWLSTPQDQQWNGRDGGGFTRVYHIVGGMEKWTDEFHLPTIQATHAESPN